jgi:pimeloyl-ACP methyl ester carboxylesterase
MALLVIPMILLVLTGLFLIGPRVKIDTKIRDAEIGADIDDYLLRSESTVPNLFPGAEKKIVWAAGKKAKTKYSIIYFHGFTASRQEIFPVVETIAEALKANVFFTRLSGHGIDDPDALKRPTVNDWLNDAGEAWQIASRIGGKIVVIGLSLGSILALWTALNRPGVASVILISPLFEPIQPQAKILLWPWGNLIARIAMGKYRRVNITLADEKYRKLATERYPSAAMVTVMGLCRLSWKFELDRISVPLLCIYAESDDVISLKRMRDELGKIDPALLRTVKIDAERHCPVGDPVSPENNGRVIREIREFLKEKHVEDGRGRG